MLDRARNILLRTAALIATVGVVAFVLGGLRTSEQCHGIRLAAVLFFCAMLAGSAHRRPRIARCAAEIGLVLVAAAGLNYARLALKWHDAGAVGIAHWWHIAFMAAACLVATTLLVRAHGHPARRRFPALRRGLTVAAGALLVGGGLVLNQEPRRPGMVVAAVVEPLRFSETDLDRLGAMLADPAQRDRLLRDPRAREILRRIGVDPGATDLPSLLRLADRAHAAGVIGFDGPPPSDVLARIPQPAAPGTTPLAALGATPTDTPTAEAAGAARGDDPTVVREGIARSVPSTRASTFTAPEGIGVAARIDPRINDRVSGKQLRAGAMRPASARDQQRRRALASGSPPPVDSGGVVAVPGASAQPARAASALTESAETAATTPDIEPAPPASSDLDPPDDAAISALLAMALDAVALPDLDPEAGPSPLSRAARTGMVILGLVLIGIALARSTRPIPPA